VLCGGGTDKVLAVDRLDRSPQVDLVRRACDPQFKYADDAFATHATLSRPARLGEAPPAPASGVCENVVICPQKVEYDMESTG